MNQIRWPQNDPDFDPVLPPVKAEYSGNPVLIVGRNRQDPERLYIENDDGFSSLVLRQLVHDRIEGEVEKAGCADRIRRILRRT